jgi:predicted metal-dependent hydrolase
VNRGSLSEVKNRFRIKNGEKEIEYEGPLNEVNKRYEKGLEWLASQPAKITTPNKKKSGKGEKTDKRGGARKAIYPPEIEKLKKANFFKPKKSLGEVIEKFESMVVPTRGKRNAILTALKADTRKKGSTLKGTKEDDTWYFMQD